MHFPHYVANFYYLPWFCSIKVSNKKLHRNAVNACGNGMCKLSLRIQYKVSQFYPSHSTIECDLNSHWHFNWAQTNFIIIHMKIWLLNLRSNWEVKFKFRGSKIVHKNRIFTLISTRIMSFWPKVSKCWFLNTSE